MERSQKNFIVRTAAKGVKAYTTLALHNYTTVAGTLVFFLLLSFVPLLFWLTLLFGRAAYFERLFTLELFDWAKGLLTYLSEHAKEATAGASVLLLGTTLWSGTGFFYHLRRSGETVYGATRRAQGWRIRLFAVFFAFLVLLYFAFAAAVVAGADLMTEGVPLWLSRLSVYALLFVFGFFGAWILNAYACPYRLSPFDTAAGSLFTSLGWLVASLAFGVYLQLASPQKLYGAFSVIIVFLLYLYWIMICFVAGMIYNFRRFCSAKYAYTRAK